MPDSENAKIWARLDEHSRMINADEKRITALEQAGGFYQKHIDYRFDSLETKINSINTWGKWLVGAIGLALVGAVLRVIGVAP